MNGVSPFFFSNLKAYYLVITSWTAILSTFLTRGPWSLDARPFCQLVPLSTVLNYITSCYIALVARVKVTGS